MAIILKLSIVLKINLLSQNISIGKRSQLHRSSVLSYRRDRHRPPQALVAVRSPTPLPHTAQTQVLALVQYTLLIESLETSLHNTPLKPASLLPFVSAMVMKIFLLLRNNIGRIIIFNWLFVN